jgi:hypothetical protein
MELTDASALATEIGQGSVFVHTDILAETSIANAVGVAVGLGPLRGRHVRGRWRRDLCE